MRRGSTAEKVSIAVVSSQYGAVCRGRLGAAVETAEQRWLQLLPVTKVTRKGERNLHGEKLHFRNGQEQVSAVD